MHKNRSKSPIGNIRMYSKVQIDNVQEFAKIIGDSVFWELLIDKKVTRLDKKTEYIIKSTKGQEHKGIAYFKSGRVSSIDPQQGSDLIIKVNYGNGFYSRYSEEMFINQFNDISPSILFQEILDCKQKKGEREGLEKERLEHQTQEEKRQEDERYLALEELAQKQEEVRLQAERQRLEAIERETKKQNLIESLKDFFQEDFLSVGSFYRNNCAQYLSNDEYQSKKSEYVRSWLEKHLNIKSDLEQAAAIGAVEGHV